MRLVLCSLVLCVLVANKLWATGDAIEFVRETRPKPGLSWESIFVLNEVDLVSFSSQKHVTAVVLPKKAFDLLRAFVDGNDTATGCGDFVDDDFIAVYSGSGITGKRDLKYILFDKVKMAVYFQSIADILRNFGVKGAAVDVFLDLVRQLKSR
jgi:hypothetical protein